LKIINKKRGLVIYGEISSLEKSATEAIKKIKQGKQKEESLAEIEDKIFLLYLKFRGEEKAAVL